MPKTMHIDTERLGVVFLREAFAPAMADNQGTILTDAASGDTVFHARVVIPGGAAGFGHTVAPFEARLRVVGFDPGIESGTPIRLEGRTSITWWTNTERGRYVDAGYTITAVAVTAAHDERPHLQGMLPVRFYFPSGGEATLLSVELERPGDDYPYTATIGMPVGHVTPQGTKGNPTVFVRTQPAEDLWRVDADWQARLVLPDRDDLGRNNKPDIVVYANALRAAGPASEYTPPERTRRGRQADTNGDTVTAVPTEENVG